MRLTFSTEAAPKAIGPYSQVVVYGGVAYLSGQIPIDPDTNQIVDGDVAAQTERVLENLKAVLQACGASLESVLKTTVFLRDMADFPKMNEVYARYFPLQPPARSTVQAARLPRDVSVEIDCIAAVL
jgi:2-iminobutanoate/2-iminopropanoate deaminase